MTDELKAALEAYKRNPDRFYADAYARAHAGDYTDALELLHGFVDAVLAHKPIPQPILDYLSLGISQYLADKDLELEATLLLKRPRHRRQGTPRDPVAPVAAMYLAMKRDGLSKTDAKAKVCEEWHIEQRTLEKYDHENNLIRTWGVARLEKMAQPVARVQSNLRR